MSSDVQKFLLWATATAGEPDGATILVRDEERRWIEAATMELRRLLRAKRKQDAARKANAQHAGRPRLPDSAVTRAAIAKREQREKQKRIETRGRSRKQKTEHRTKTAE